LFVAQVCYALNNEWKHAPNPDSWSNQGEGDDSSDPKMGASFVSHLLSVAFVESGPQVFYPS
jgi:hypothetical protein